MKTLHEQIHNCKICAEHLLLGPRPVFVAHPKARVLIVGQAPGLAVHKSGVPWDDKSGDNLRNWLAIDKSTFYNPEIIGIVPMAFCYPGKGKSGDLPPRKECAPQWHEPLLQTMPNLQLILLVGSYAQNYYLPNNGIKTLTERVKNYELFLPKYFVLPHPSPRNNIWMAKNEWFKKLVLPELKRVFNEVV